VAISDLGRHAGGLSGEVFFVPDLVRPLLDEPDLVVDAFHKPQGDLLSDSQSDAISLQFRSTIAACH
jgi:hypothetical protein